MKHENREHWLDYADDKYDKTLISDTKAALRVLFLYIPLPFFWALFDQQVSFMLLFQSMETGHNRTDNDNFTVCMEKMKAFKYIIPIVISQNYIPQEIKYIIFQEKNFNLN